MLIFVRNLLIALGIVALLLFSAISLNAAQLDLPMPRGTEVVLLIRPELLSSEIQLMDWVSQSQAVGHYLELMGVTFDQVEYAAIFMPYDPAWLDRVDKRAANTLPPTGAMIIKGKFDLSAKYKEIKSSGWKEEKYASRKLLWWSTGETYLDNPSGQECLAMLANDRLLIAGSTESMKGVLDVAGAKAPGVESMGVFPSISQDFFENNLAMASVFVKVTDDLRQKIKTDVGGQQSAMIKSAISYVDNTQEAALSVIQGTGNYLLDGYLGMDSGNNAMVVTSVLQASGGLASLLPRDNPGRDIVESLAVTRTERIIRLQSNLTHERFAQLLASGGR